MTTARRAELTRAKFDAAYERFIRTAGFFEPDGYYDISRERYWLTLCYLADVRLPRPAEILEIGGGQMAILASKLFGDHGVVGDISENYRAPVDAADVPWEKINLMEDDPAAMKGRFDAIVLAEVIEHLPIPPYVILGKLRTWLKPDGVVFLTTPNLFRLRNLIRMAAGRDPFDRFILPRPDLGLGHQTEYSADHLGWQIREAGFILERMEHDQLGATGFSWKARLGRAMLAPLRLRAKWREGLVAVGRNPA